MNEFWVVVYEEGEYSGFTSECAGVFTSEAEANAQIKRATQRLQEMKGDDWEFDRSEFVIHGPLRNAIDMPSWYDYTIDERAPYMDLGRE